MRTLLTLTIVFFLVIAVISMLPRVNVTVVDPVKGLHTVGQTVEVSDGQPLMGVYEYAQEWVGK